MMWGIGKPSNTIENNEEIQARGIDRETLIKAHKETHDGRIGKQTINIKQQTKTCMMGAQENQTKNANITEIHDGGIGKAHKNPKQRRHP